jgi:hypothetical protein
MCKKNNNNKKCDKVTILFQLTDGNITGHQAYISKSVQKTKTNKKLETNDLEITQGITIRILTPPVDHETFDWKVL